MKAHYIKLSISILMAIVVFSRGSLAAEPKEKPTWKNNFSAYLSYIKQVDEAPEKDAKTIAKEMLNIQVTWTGTVKYIRKNRLYIRESFVEADNGYKMARVMYRLPEEEGPNWSHLKPGQSISYTGIITELTNGIPEKEKSFYYAELKNIKLIRQQNE